MRSRRIGIAFAVTLLAFYLALGIPALLVLPGASLPFWMLAAVLQELLALAIAIELAELLFGLLLRGHPHARAVCDAATANVAVLYLCCDDVDAESLASLAHLGSFEVFILDDSRMPASRDVVDRSGLTVIRRPDRRDYKAGNLNHWLEAFGHRYDYFVVLDSDSLITRDAILELVSYAEAAENADVAIVQSSTLPRAGNRFQQLIGSQHGARNRILARLYDAIGWTLSHGHNNLHRTAALRAIGGFDTSASCEDTATSLRLSRHGWRVILVDTASRDAEPKDVFAFRRRYVRWARQTVDAILGVRFDVGLAQTLLLARHLLGYVFPATAMLAMALVVLVPMSGGERWLSPLQVAVTWICAAGVIAAAILRLLLALRTGQRFRTFVLATCLQIATAAFCCLATAGGILRSGFRRRVEFIPTGSADRARPTLRRLALSMIGSWIAYAIVGAISVLDGRHGAAIFWIACFVGAPLILWLFHLDQPRREVVAR